jgi:hypothetical protein
MGVVEFFTSFCYPKKLAILLIQRQKPKTVAYSKKIKTLYFINCSTNNFLGERVCYVFNGFEISLKFCVFLNP